MSVIPKAASLRDLVFLQERDYSLPIGAGSSPHGSAPIVDRQVTLSPGRCCQDIGNRDAAAILGHMHTRPFSFSASKFHVYSLDLAARKLFFDVKIKAHQAEHNANRLAVVVGGLHGEGVHHVLQDKSGAAHRVDVDFIESGARGIHVEDSLARDLRACGRVGRSWSTSTYRLSTTID